MNEKTTARRQFIRALAALSAASLFGQGAGVQLGVQTYSFHHILNDGPERRSEEMPGVLSKGPGVEAFLGRFVWRVLLAPALHGGHPLAEGGWIGSGA
jgi:hypothetical protein